MTPVIIALTFAVTATLWWAAKPLNRNHAERDAEAALRGGSTHERNDQ